VSVLRATVLCLLAGGVLLLVPGCGGSSGSSTAEAGSATTGTTGDAMSDEESETVEEASTPAEALAEIDLIGPLLEDAAGQYGTGDHEGAADAVGDIYLEHFEKVEGPLGDVNHDLMERLEEQISTDLRNAMRDDASNSEIASMVMQIQSDLDEARAALGG
jgi:hypothetical protein